MGPPAQVGRCENGVGGNNVFVAIATTVVVMWYDVKYVLSVMHGKCKVTYVSSMDTEINNTRKHIEPFQKNAS